MNKKFLAIAAVCVAGAAGAWAWGHAAPGKPEAAPTKKKDALVSAITVELRELPLMFTAQGHVVALNQVDIRPQLAGVVRAVHFHEGDQVKVGQLLFSLDAADTSAQLSRAQSAAAQVKAQLEDARREARRAATLVASHFLAPSAAESATGKVDALEAQWKAALAEAQAAQVQLARTEIRSPINGRSGALSVHPGSLAQPTAAALVTLAQFDPIGFEFSLPERDLAPLLAAGAKVGVALSLPGHAKVAGTLSFINYTVNTETGTINLKASFPNADKRLWPGAFGEVALLAGVRAAVALLPPQTVREGPKGRYVYVIGADRKVSAKPVQLQGLHEQMAVVSGLAGGESIVLDGDQSLRAGAAVLLADAGKAAGKAKATP